jgi:hypothetical protein
MDDTTFVFADCLVVSTDLDEYILSKGADSSGCSAHSWLGYQENHKCERPKDSATICALIHQKGPGA